MKEIMQPIAINNILQHLKKPTVQSKEEHKRRLKQSDNYMYKRITNHGEKLLKIEKKIEKTKEKLSAQEDRASRIYEQLKCNVGRYNDSLEKSHTKRIDSALKFSAKSHTKRIADIAAKKITASKQEKKSSPRPKFLFASSAPPDHLLSN